MTKTRFAPSPTGYIHIGNVRSALYPFLIARQTGGEFILRIEDTDQNRFVEGAEEMILDTLKWLGINWDGEIIHQTSRREIYQKYAQKLIDDGFAYADPYTAEQVQEFREKCVREKNPFLFRDFRPTNPPKWEPGLPLRFCVKNPKRYDWNDEVMGELSAGAEALDDFILIKADGLPTYNFAHIVDDYEMGVTHVIRGNEYIASQPKYLSLYDALGIKWPKFAHVPHIMAPEGNKKLGKRDGAKSVTEYKNEGILPEAMVNFLAELGWNDGTEQDIFSMDELVEKFSLDRVHKSGARFDERRLIWLNSQWIQKYSLEKLTKVCENFWSESGKNADEKRKLEILKVIQPRLKTLRDLAPLSEYFFVRPSVNWDMISENKQLKKVEKAELVKYLGIAKEFLEKLSDDDFKNEEILQETLNKYLEKTEQKPVVGFGIVRFALTWAPFSPGLPETMKLIGREETLARIECATK